MGNTTYHGYGTITTMQVHATLPSSFISNFGYSLLHMMILKMHVLVVQVPAWPLD
jgi:hypothetical protein